MYYPFSLKNKHKTPAKSSLRAFMVRSPGFEPGSSAWEAGVLAKLDYDRPYLVD